MHELPVVQSLMTITLDHAARHNARRVLALNLVIGQLSSIVDDCVQFYWDILARDTIAAGARLNFRRIPARFRCHDCGAEFALNESSLICPNCGGSHFQLLQGDEFRLESIDIEEDDPIVERVASASDEASNVKRQTSEKVACQ